MSKYIKKRKKRGKKDLTSIEVRKKLGVTQEQLAAMFKVSPSYISLVESGKRDYQSSSNFLLSSIYLQFYELETGIQASYRSLETRLFLNAEYKKLLPKMASLEQEYRNKIKELKIQLDQMKEDARDAEHAIIVLTTVINKFSKKDKANYEDDIDLVGLNLLKQQAYERLLKCWEPGQANLHRKIEAVAGEARALRRYRVKIVREHNPKKKVKKEAGGV